MSAKNNIDIIIQATDNASNVLKQTQKELSDFSSSSSTLNLFLSDSLAPESIKGTDKSNSTEKSLIPENLLLGFDNFKQTGNSIYFFAYAIFKMFLQLFSQYSNWILSIYKKIN